MKSATPRQARRARRLSNERRIGRRSRVPAQHHLGGAGRRSGSPPLGADQASPDTRECHASHGLRIVIACKVASGQPRRVAFGRSGCEATEERAASAVSETEAAGGFAEGSRSSDLGHQASSHRDVRARGGEPSGPPGTSVPPQPRISWSDSSGGRESRRARSPSQREASVSSRVRAVAARALRRQDAIPSGSTSVEGLEPRVGRPARVVRGACLCGPATDAGQPARVEAAAKRAVTTGGHKAAVTRYGC